METTKALPSKMADKGTKPLKENLLNLISYKDASIALALPVGTLYALVSKRRIPHIRLGARLVRFDPAQLLAWIGKRKVESMDVPDKQQDEGPTGKRACP